MAIRVHTQGNPMTANDFAQETKIGARVLHRFEVRPGDGVGSVIDGGQQAHRGSPSFQSFMRAAVQKEHKAFLGFSFPPPPMARRPALDRGENIFLPQDGPQSGPAQRQTFHGGHLFPHMGIVEAAVFSPGQADDLIYQILWQASRRDQTTIPVIHTLHPFLADLLLETMGLPEAQVQYLGSFLSGTSSAQGLIQHGVLLDLLLTHEYFLHGQRVTFSCSR